MIKYINSQTNKEVKYGEIITYHEEKKLSGCHLLIKDVTLPIINDTLPDLIKKGIIIQKEVKDEDKSPKPKEKRYNDEFSINEKLDILAEAMSSLSDEVDLILRLLKINA